MRTWTARCGAAALWITGMLVANSALAADPTSDWVAFVGGSTRDEFRALAVDVNGSVYLAGESTGGLWKDEYWGGKLKHPFTEPADLLVAKLTTDGHPVWYRFLGGVDSEKPAAAVVAEGILYVAATSAGDWPPASCSVLSPTPSSTGIGRGVIVKFDAATGACLGAWMLAQEHSIRTRAVVVDAGHLVIAGKRVTGSDDSGLPCVVKLAPSGAVDWDVCIGDTKGDAFGVALHGGSVFVTGELGFPSGDNPAVKVSAPFVATKTSEEGAFRHASIGPPGEVGRSLAVGADAAIYVAGDNGEYAFAKRARWVGTEVHVEKTWNLRTITDSGDSDDAARGITILPNGVDDVDVYVVGDTSGTKDPFPLVPLAEVASSNGEDSSKTEAWLAKLDKDLSLEWWTFMGDVELEHGYALAMDASGHLYAAGQGTRCWPDPYWGTPTMEHHPSCTSVAGSWDLFVVRFAVASGGGGASCAETCSLSRRVEEWGKFVRCIEYGVATHYRGETETQQFVDCRDAYLDFWDESCAQCMARFVPDEHTVLDNLTGLVWEKKTNVVNVNAPQNEADHHDVNNKYSWSDGAPWVESGPAFRVFLRSLNDGQFAGASGWRLPTLVELQTLMNRTEPGVSPDFPNVNSTGGYWSATASPFLEGGEACRVDRPCAWDVIFKNDPLVLPIDGTAVGVNGRNGNRHVRAVRGGW